MIMLIRMIKISMMTILTEFSVLLWTCCTFHVSYASRCGDIVAVMNCRNDGIIRAEGTAFRSIATWKRHWGVTCKTAWQVVRTKALSRDLLVCKTGNTFEPIYSRWISTVFEIDLNIGALLVFCYVNTIYITVLVFFILYICHTWF
jgi:hypothetical protein